MQHEPTHFDVDYTAKEYILSYCLNFIIIASQPLTLPLLKLDPALLLQGSALLRPEHLGIGFYCTRSD